jgi:hypothetical protein
MLLNRHDGILFFKLHRALMHFVNQRLKVVTGKMASPDEFSHLSPEARLKVRDAFLGHTDTLASFVEENPAHLTEEELDIVRSWRHFVYGKFYIFRQLQKYTVFLSSAKQPVAYGVLALSLPLEEVIGPYLPVMTDTMLLPFKDVIVYDGLLTGYNIRFGGGIRRMFAQSYKEAKARHGIVTSLPMSDQPLSPKPAKLRPAPKRPSREEKEEALHTVIGLVDRFCKEHLNEEYAGLCRKLAERLARNRPSPLLHGNLHAWASGIIRAVGWVNFLGDKSQTPPMRLSDIDADFGIGESTGAAKLAAIRKMLNLYQLDPRWTLPSRLDDSPMAWMLQVNGLLMDVRHAPREVQEVAFNKGLIPYIPADRRSRP